ncbi:hypothetical protein KI743_24315 [Vibrio sp. D420a]|nr:hypothetical protein [Vibrio sp. D420a]MDK9765119.1 hypothetical protein [Vibrio sp. D420a]
MTINKYFVFAPQATEEQVKTASTDKESQRLEALRQAQQQGGMSAED